MYTTIQPELSRYDTIFFVLWMDQLSIINTTWLGLTSTSRIIYFIKDWRYFIKVFELFLEAKGEASQSPLDDTPKIMVCDPLNDKFFTSLDHPCLSQDLSYFVLKENDTSSMFMNRYSELIRVANSTLNIFLI